MLWSEHEHESDTFELRIRILMANPSAGLDFNAANVYLAVILLRYLRLYCLSSISSDFSLLVFTSKLVFSNADGGEERNNRFGGLSARQARQFLRRLNIHVESHQKMLFLLSRSSLPRFIRMALHCRSAVKAREKRVAVHLTDGLERPAPRVISA